MKLSVRLLRRVAAALLLLSAAALLALSTAVVPRATPGSVADVQGTFVRSFEGGDLDTVIVLQEYTRPFYVNRGYDDHAAFDVAAFEREVRPGDAIVLTAYRRWLPDSPAQAGGSIPLAGVRSDQATYLDTAWMAEAHPRRTVVFYAAAAMIAGLLLLWPDRSRSAARPPARIT